MKTPRPKRGVFVMALRVLALLIFRAKVHLIRMPR
jgi:hypothetical protein